MPFSKIKSGKKGNKRLYNLECNGVKRGIKGEQKGNWKTSIKVQEKGTSGTLKGI